MMPSDSKDLSYQQKETFESFPPTEVPTVDCAFERINFNSAQASPPLSPPPLSPPPPNALANISYRSFNSTKNRSRVVSLDRGQELMLGTSVRMGDMNDDDNSTVTSDGESSYFAKNLPSPKSGRLSFTSDAGSISSAPARTGPMFSRASDASLSFSDDEEEDVEGNNNEDGNGPPKRRSSFPTAIPLPANDLQFRGIARMHSASSLLTLEDAPPPPPPPLPGGSQHIDDTDKTRSSLMPNHEVNNSNDRDYKAEKNPFNRELPRQSSPSIMHSQFPHIKGAFDAQTNLPRQMQPWINNLGQPAPSYGFIESLSPSLYSATDESKGSQGTVTLVYSEDDDNDVLVAPIGGSTRSRGAPGETITGIKRKPAGEENSFEEQNRKFSSRSRTIGHPGVLSSAKRDGLISDGLTDEGLHQMKGFKVYWKRWLMLFYMSVLNLLSDWTCYSVAPIAFLTREAFGSIDPEQLVVVFLVANAIATASEPILLARLGLRRTVIFGALLLMIGSVVKSGGFPPIIASNLQKGKGEWRIYLGFFLVGLSQPLYQCTPALLSASWFPEKERTLATGVALNANQLGIGCAFAFGTLLVGSSDDIVPYFGLLSIISSITFLGTLIQFDDAPPTPPSDTAKVMRGTMEWKLPNTEKLWNSVRNFKIPKEDRSLAKDHDWNQSKSNPVEHKEGAAHKHTTRRRWSKRHAYDGQSIPTLPKTFNTDDALDNDQRFAPSPMLPGPVGSITKFDTGGTTEREDEFYEDFEYNDSHLEQGPLPGPMGVHPYYVHPHMHPNAPYVAGYPNMQPAPQYHNNQVPLYPFQQPWPHAYNGPSQVYPLPHHQSHFMQPPWYSYYESGQSFPHQQNYYQPNYYEYDERNIALAPPSFIEEYAEPTLTLTDHHLDINIRDDQVLLSVKACMARSGFIHALVTFTVSGIVINTLSTYMDYLVRLNGAGREYVGIVGGSFQVVIMLSSLIVGKQTDKTRAYYSVTIAMLVLGAFALAECGVSLDADRGGDLRWSLIVVAALVGPLQPVSTELGVEVVFPLSENTVLVIQQLFSNLLSALFIPFFKALRDVGTERISETELYERPQYTFSFYLLIVLHASVTVFFATFNGRYLRFEREMLREEKNKREQNKVRMEPQETYRDGDWDTQYYHQPTEGSSVEPNERQPLVRKTRSSK
jgi:Major Facilitator Superfamily